MRHTRNRVDFLPRVMFRNAGLESCTIGFPCTQVGALDAKKSELGADLTPDRRLESIG